MSALFVPTRTIATFIFRTENKAPAEKKTDNKQEYDSFKHSGLFVLQI